ncbi:MAG: hypothetical protein GXP28_08130 [Planctomycetes bacterium]|nr:hypothetical protein [Planctomycetota bacterium]
MLDIHTIRLRHPWQHEPCERGTRWLRSFNWPAGLVAREIARLVIDPLPDSAVVRLNGQTLVAEAEGLFDITSLLAEHNRLALELSGSASAGDTVCPFDVRLEIVEG